VRFLVDANLPPALADWLTGRGCDAIHVRETGSASRPDREIWSEALAGGFLIITKDQDFARRRSAAGAPRTSLAATRGSA
jgi:predicted nuclease of predicted toxin-antitoxin system